MNAGWVSKAPIYDGAIDDVTGTPIPQTNEKFTSYETGVRYVSADQKFNLSSSFYFTRWRDRTVTRVNDRDNTITYQRGIDSNYGGLEIEGGYQPSRFIRFDAAASFGNWYYTKDVQFQQYDISTGESTVTSGSMLYLKGLKVGDAPQSQIAVGTTVFPTHGLSLTLQGRNYNRYWSDYLPENRTNASDRSQSWEIPHYSVFDLHVSYQLPIDSEKFDVRVFAHVFNLFDKTYVSDATDESSFEAVSTSLAAPHSAQRAEVFLGAPRTFNAGATVSF